MAQAWFLMRISTPNILNQDFGWLLVMSKKSNSKLKQWKFANDERKIYIRRIKDNSPFFTFLLLSFWIWPFLSLPWPREFVYSGPCLQRNGSFHLYLLESSCQVRNVSTQRTILMEAKPHGEALEDDNWWWGGAGGGGVQNAEAHQAPDMWVKKWPWKGILWPSHACWWHVDQRWTTWTSPPWIPDLQNYEQCKNGDFKPLSIAVVHHAARADQDIGQEGVS